MINLVNAVYFISKAHFNMEITPVRRVQFYEIELYTTENGTSIINEKEYSHRNGNILIAVPGMLRRSRKSFECYTVKFTLGNDENINDYMRQLAGVSYLTQTEHLKKIYNDIFKCYCEKSPAKELYMDGKVRELIAEIYNMVSFYNKDSIFSEYGNNICTSVEFIKQNFSEKILLDDMAKIANMSPSFFHRIFKSVIGKTPLEFITEQRINHAYMLLRNSSFSIDRISELCGFSSRQYFDTVFKKSEGKTPAEFRKSIKQIV